MEDNKSNPSDRMEKAQRSEIREAGGESTGPLYEESIWDRGGLDAGPELEPGFDIDQDILTVREPLETPELGGGGLHSNPTQNVGGIGGSPYVPPNSSERIEGSGYLDIAREYVEESPFRTGINRDMDRMAIERPDGILLMEETENGLAMFYQGDMVKHPETSRDEKNIYKFGETEVADREIDNPVESPVNGWIYSEGEHRELRAENLGQRMRLGSLGSAYLSVSMEITEKEYVHEILDAFSNPDYQPEGFE